MFNAIKDMITESEPIICKYISTPKDMSTLNCSAFVAGIIEGMLEASEFVCLQLTQL